MSEFRICIATDAHIYPEPWAIGSLTKTVFQNCANDKPEIFFTLGDDYFVAAQEASESLMYFWSNPEVLRDTWKRVYENVGLVTHSAFYVPVLGNHEGLYGWKTEHSLYQVIMDARKAYNPLPDQNTFPEGGDPHGRYGAFSWGDCLFVWLDVVGFCTEDPKVAQDNSLYILGQEQKTFLETTLQASTAPWKFLFAHHLFGGDDGWLPGYGRGNANHALKYEQAEIQGMMELYGVQAFFYGHDHAFCVSDCNGIKYICCGVAGNGCPWPEVVTQYAPFPVEVNGGHVRIDVSTTSVTISYILASDDPVTNGTVVSSYTMIRE